MTTDVPYTGRSWYRWNAGLSLIVGVFVAIGESWWIGLLVILGALVEFFVLSENLLPRLAQRRAARSRISA